MRIRSTGHSGFHVELEEMNLLFDYYRGELPVPDPDKPLFVFVNHVHPDHFQKSTFSPVEWADNVVYFLSDYMRCFALPLWVQGSVRLFAPETETEFCRLMRDAKSGEPRQGTFLKVSTYRLTDEGVAFLADTAKARIYHAGNLNDWHWEENTAAENNTRRTLYLGELWKIRAEVERSKRIPDTTSVPVDSRFGADYWRGADAYMREAGAHYLVPTYLYSDASVIQKLQEREASRPYRDKILGTGREGEVFTL